MKVRVYEFTRNIRTVQEKQRKLRTLDCDGVGYGRDWKGHAIG